VLVKMGDLTLETTGGYGRMFASKDGGAHFTELMPVDDVNDWAGDVSLGPGVFYYSFASAMAVDPRDEDRIITGSVRLYRSRDGGRSLRTWQLLDMQHVHADIHAVVFDPRDHRHVYVATDGGVSESTDGGDTWAKRSNGLVTTQCYHIGVSQSSGLDVGITTQDNSCHHSRGSLEFESFPRGFWEGGWIEYDPRDARVIYVDDWTSNGVARSTDGGGQWLPLGIDTVAIGSTNVGKPFAITGDSSGALLAGQSGGPLFRSSDRGVTWASVLSVPGDSFTAVRFAPSDAAFAYAGSLLGRLWRSEDAGNTWTEIPPVYPATSFPPGVQALTVDWHDSRRVFAVFDNGTIYRIDSLPDQTRGWDVTGAPGARLPDVPVTSVVLDPRFEEILYSATRLGVYWSTDGGDSWAPFDEGLPNCVVSEMQLRVTDMTLYASTFGRGVYRRRL